VSKLIAILIVVVIIVIVVGGVIYYSFSRRGLEGVVTITSVELWLSPEKVTEAATPVEVHISVNNSFPVSVRIESGNLRVVLSDLTLILVSIPAQEVKRGIATLLVNAILDNTLLDDFWYSHLSSRERSDMSIEGSVKFLTPIGVLEMPVKYSSAIETKIFPIERELIREYNAGILGKVVVKKLTVELAEVTPSETKLRAYITIENDLRIPLYINWIVFDVKTGGEVILGTGEQETPKSITPGEIDTIIFNIVINNSKIPKLWVEHLRSREKTTININIWLRVNIAGVGIEIFKENPLTVSTKFETSIFKYKT